MTDHPSALVSVPEPMIEAFRDWYALHFGRPIMKGKARKIVGRILSAAPAAPQAAGVGERERPLCVIAFREGKREPELISWKRMPVGEHWLYSEAQNLGFLIDTDDGTEWVDEDPRRCGIPEHFENVRPLTLQVAKDEMLSAWEVRSELEAALRAPSREPEGGAVDEPLKWFLKVIEGAGGEVCSTESRHNPINVFCEDRDNGDDTFNISEAAGYTQTSHDTSFDTSTTRITDKGRTYLAALRAQPPAREDAQPFGYWVEHKSAENPVLIRHGSFVPASDHYKITTLYTHPAHDALRVAVEALVEARQNLIDCGDHFGAGRCADALAALQAEQKGGAA